MSCTYYLCESSVTEIQNQELSRAEHLRQTHKETHLKRNEQMSVSFFTGLTGSNPGDNFRYDVTYGGVISSDGLLSTYGDYGNANYNDHALRKWIY